MATTLQDVRNICYGILREDEDVNAYPLVLMDAMINTAYLKICNGRVVNPLNKEEVRKGKLPFLNTDKFYSNVQSTSLSEATTLGGSTITVADTSNFPSSGKIYIGGNIITYTGKTDTTFTGCSGVLFAFPTGLEVSIAYDLPTDYGIALNLIYNNSLKLEPKNYDDIFEDLNGLKADGYDYQYYDGINTGLRYIRPFYSIKDRSYLLVYNLQSNGARLLFRYEKLPTKLTASTDTFLIDIDQYTEGTIPYLAVGEILYNRGEEERAAELINFGLGNVKEMYTYYNNSTHEKISGVQYRSGKSRFNI